MLGLNIDVTPLLERADELRVKGRDLMRQAQASMGSLGKTTEQEIPLMYR
jgi:predicted ATP-grasp superfamily ATP-dependent carboligase